MSIMGVSSMGFVPAVYPKVRCSSVAIEGVRLGVGELHERRRRDDHPVVPGQSNGDGPHPAVLILRGVAGPDDGSREIARRLARVGVRHLLHGWKNRAPTRRTLPYTTTWREP